MVRHTVITSKLRGNKLSTVETAFNARRNSLNAIRLVLATLVIVSHSWPIGGYGADPAFGDQDLGDWALAGFFAISGYLITASRVATPSLLDYSWRRFLRIYPGFLAALLVVAFVMAPASELLGRTGNYDWSSGAGFVANNAAVMMRQWGIDGTLQAVPFAGTWNGSAWTLFYELLCYAAVGILVSILPTRVMKPAVIAAFVACVLVTTAAHTFGAPIPEALELTARLGGFFSAGVIVYLFRDRVVLNAGGAILSLLLLVGIAAAWQFQVLAGMPVAYLMMYLGARLPFTQIGARNDISYGMYIYAFPVQQLIATAYPNQELPLPIFIAASILLTLPFAWASWLLVEKPAMRFKRLMKKRTAVLTAGG